MTVGSIDGMTMSVSHKTEITLQSMHSRYKRTLNCLVTGRVTGKLPKAPLNISPNEIPANINLADPTYSTPGEVDILIGAGLFWDLLCIGKIKLANGETFLHRTKLGWIVIGQLTITETKSFQISAFSLTINHDKKLHEQVSSFWEIENNYKSCKPLSEEEDACEKYFNETTTRDPDGRFVVSIPLKENLHELGELQQIARRRFYAVERRLDKNPILKENYIGIVNNYLELGDMAEIEEDDVEADLPLCYLPHHPVFKESSTTTKVRIVFDGSVKTSTGVSINDVQKVGPVIQDDLFGILLRYRTHPYVISADIEQMYRQVLIQKDQRSLQRIIWRPESSLSLKEYELNRVTFGMASSPFLAIRSLIQLGYDHQETFPEASRVILKDFYVDDLITGANTIEEARQLRSDLITILQSAARKWITNDPFILDQKEHTQTEKSISDQKDKRTLGVIWDSENDTLKYSLNMIKNSQVTKRIILSTVAQIFDPLGLINPVTVMGKIILQEVWKHQLGWDEDVSTAIKIDWTQFVDQLPVINNYRIQRHIACLRPVLIQIHGFCDASMKAYGASVYIRSTDENQTTVRLLCAKSRVAPLKTQSLPRLELCSALLLAELTVKVSTSINLRIEQCVLWSDSTVALAWIQSSPHRWKTFVSNRTAEIQELTKGAVWRHVPTYYNPADLVSRGATPRQLLDSSLWWEGPDWLTKDSSHWPQSPIIGSQGLPEERDISCHVITTATEGSDLVKTFSNLTNLLRVIAYCLRFRHNAGSPKEVRQLGSLTPQELNNSMLRLVASAQSEAFSQDIKELKKTNTVSKNSKLLTLNPFLENGLIRVGGRLQNANITHEQKHPLLLPIKHPLTRLIIQYEHERCLHGGCQAVLAAVRLRFWPLAARPTIKNVLSKCIVCFKARPKGIIPMMGNLPESRVTPSRPFITCGVDYAGPVYIKDGKTRNRKIVKSYLCIFVCFSTKAVHIELANDLSTEAFFNCFRRFVSRRGLSKDIYSDNGTNFVGASNELRELGELLNDLNKTDSVFTMMTTLGITWHFIPPRSPNFGGLWESAVKLTKYHLVRITKNSNFTFEEMYTVLTQIGAVLNFRPLYPLSNDPNDLNPLTPAHFLIGSSLLALPGEDLREVKENRLSRYQRVQQVIQNFWVRWSMDYLHNLQQRYKWQQDPDQRIIPGALIVIRDDNLPPLKWQMGRIVELHPGADKITRVVTVKTHNGLFKRPVSKICLLPIETDDS